MTPTPSVTPLAINGFKVINNSNTVNLTALGTDDVNYTGFTLNTGSYPITPGQVVYGTHDAVTVGPSWQLSGGVNMTVYLNGSLLFGPTPVSGAGGLGGSYLASDTFIFVMTNLL